LNYQRLFYGLAISSFALFLSACGSNLSIEQEDVNQMIESLEQQALEAEQTAKRRFNAGLFEARVDNPNAALNDQRLTVDVNKARIDAIFNKLGIYFTLLDSVKLNARVSAKFNDVPLPEALALLLEPAQLRARIDNNIVTISRLPQIQLDLEKPNDLVLKKYRLRYTNSEQLRPVLNALLGSYDEDDDYSSDTPPSLKLATIANENAIILQGTTVDVANAVELIKTLDIDTGHVIIQAMVLSFSSDKLVDIGTRISDGFKNQYSDISLDWSNITGENISFTNLVGASNDSTFRAAISLLLNRGYAEIISRPFLATMSGEEASLEAVIEQYVTVISGDAEFSLETVTSGVNLKITPVILPDEQVRLGLDVSSSQFVPSLNNASLARGRSSATSTVRIGSGNSLVIGGLLAEENTRDSSGLPYLSKVPALGTLFGSKREANIKKRVLIYITPYIWEPGLETPNNINNDIDTFLNEWKSRGEVD